MERYTEAQRAIPFVETTKGFFKDYRCKQRADLITALEKPIMLLETLLPRSPSEPFLRL